MKAKNRARIVLVEDDPSLMHGLSLNLRHRGHEVQTAMDGVAGLQAALEPGVDLLVLDLMLPGLDGLTLLNELRRRGRSMPVLILSARGALDDKVQGLRQGADDYVTKPFELPELMARVEAILRRHQADQTGEERILFGPLVIDLAQHCVMNSGAVVPVSAREFRLLVLLVRHPGRIRTRDEILNKLWDWTYDGTPRTVDNLIVRLRRKLKDDPGHSRWIQTVRGVGYRWATAP